MEQRTCPHNGGSLTLDNLPFDIKDDIISSVDAPSDLLCLALANKEWTSMIIPNHIEYRELEIRVDHPEIWQHLATRVDLAKNVRSVRITRQITSSKGLSSLTLANFQTFMKKRTQLWKIHRSKCLQPFRTSSLCRDSRGLELLDLQCFPILFIKLSYGVGSCRRSSCGNCHHASTNLAQNLRYCTVECRHFQELTILLCIIDLEAFKFEETLPQGNPVGIAGGIREFFHIHAKELAES